MRIAGTRFGEIDIDDGKEIVFPRGLIGFADARRYVLIEPRGRGAVAWLQCLEIPALAFPVVDGAAIGADYPRPSAAELAVEAGLAADDLALLVVVAARKGEGLVANLLAPIVIDLTSRTGAQVVLDHKRFSPSVRMGAAEESSAERVQS
jgi:flagellar assembly factor FliW